ncbi:type VI secretion protein [Streptomyces arenae]|uniref:type VI secretion protein n=1 Tax=Streptomyces arenae TaxID=29301 RepID=UPI002659D8AE|nr:type VI secretion protein [Streptomyces arenae]MCG7210281.1 type VI secretion protein [Streptomyces arenae]
MRPDPREEREHRSGGGVPDGLLIGILGFLLGVTLLVWTATGLAAWFAHGSWPSTVTLTHTPPAMRHLIGEPHDVTGAWPDTPAARLSGWGLFWGLFLGQLMILLVLGVFVMGTVARWRAARRSRRTTAGQAVAGQTAAGQTTAGQATAGQATTPDAAPSPTRAPVQAPSPAVLATGTEQVPLGPAVPAPATEQVTPGLVGGLSAPASASAGLDAHSSINGERVGSWAKIHLAPVETRRTTATQAIRDAAGPALVVTSNPAVWSETKDARAKLGPALLYDPNHLCDTPARFHWSPTTGCADKQTAALRAQALLTPVKPTAKIDQAVTDTAETLLRSYLHAAALENRTIRHVHRWAQGTGVQDAVRTLRTHPKAAPGAAGELEAALTAHAERRDIAQELTARALSALFTVNIREACNPNRSDALALDSFVDEGGTLYVVGESIEDPRTNPGAMPLLTALVSSVVEQGRRMAERSSSGRLDPPLTLVLDDVAAVAPLPQLPDLLTTGPDQGLPTLALLRSHEQARSRWPHRELPV